MPFLVWLGRGAECVAYVAEDIVVGGAVGWMFVEDSEKRSVFSHEGAGWVGQHGWLVWRGNNYVYRVYPA